MATQLLPSNPNLDQLKRQAREFLRAWKAGDAAALADVRAWLPQHGGAPKLSDAQHLTARRYSFRTWARLKQFVESSTERPVNAAALALREAIDADRGAEILRILERDPALIDEHVWRAPNAYRNQRALAYACQRGRVEAVRALLAAGADPREDGFLAVARGAMRDDQLPVLRLLFDDPRAQLDPNLHAYNWGPLLLYPCECLSPGVIRFLIERGADPNRAGVGTACTDTPLQMVLGTYARGPERAECLEALIAGGATFEDGPVMDLQRGRLDVLRRQIAVDPGLVSRQFDGLNYGATGARGQTVGRGTLLHLAAEFCLVDAARLLIECGADVNARSAPPAEATPESLGPTALFFAVTQFNGWGAPLVRLLLDHGADRSLVATVRGRYGRPEEILSCTALEYAERFPDGSPARPKEDRTLDWLREG